MSDWQLSYNQSGTLIRADCSFRNLLGSLIDSASIITAHESGAQTPLCGIFVLTVVSTNGVSISAKDAADLQSPALLNGIVPIVADGSTPNLDIIPGVSIVFSAGIFVGWVAEIGVGCCWDSSINQWQRITSLGLGLVNIDGSDRVVTVTNMTGGDQSNSAVVVTNGARIVNGLSTSRPIFAFRQTGLLNPIPDTDLLGKTISFANLVLAGTLPTGGILYGEDVNTIDILVAGGPIDVYDVTHDALIVGGLGLLCDGLTVYRFADGTPYQSCEFILSPALAATDTAQIYISDGGAFVELYDPVNGGYVPGPAGVILTADNCGIGVVLAGDSVQFTMRLNPPTGKDPSLNQRQFSLRIYSEGISGILPTE